MGQFFSEVDPSVKKTDSCIFIMGPQNMSSPLPAQ